MAIRCRSLTADNGHREFIAKLVSFAFERYPDFTNGVHIIDGSGGCPFDPGQNGGR
jgi:hypothetical protein